MSDDPVRRLILASASPRRRELIAALGLPFEVEPSAVDETSSEDDPARLAEGLALRKARAVAAAHADGVVVGSDTVVALEGRLLEKPGDAAAARAMLEALRGRAHTVVSGVAVVRGERVAADHALATVTMREYTGPEVEAFIASGEPFDKAGGYAIQDPDFRPVARLDGCECAVIGLPLWTLQRVLRAVGIEAPPPGLERCAACPGAPR